MKLSVIVPAYNEAHHIADNIAALDGVLRKLQRDYEIIVVDDGSPDHTTAAAQQVARRYRQVTVVTNPQNLGKGQSIKRGFEHATGGIIAFIDADMDLHPKQLGALIEQLELAQADIAIGSKMHPRSKVAYPLNRRILSWGYRRLTRLLFRLNARDTQVGLKVFRRAVLDEVMPRVLVKRFAFDVELLVLATYYGYGKIVEVPVELHYRYTSSVRPRDVKDMLQDTLAVFYRLRILRYYQRQRPAPALRPLHEGTLISELRTGPVAEHTPDDPEVGSAAPAVRPSRPAAPTRRPVRRKNRRLTRPAAERGLSRMAGAGRTDTPPKRSATRTREKQPVAK